MAIHRQTSSKCRQLRSKCDESVCLAMNIYVCLFVHISLNQENLKWCLIGLRKLVWYSSGLNCSNIFCIWTKYFHELLFDICWIKSNCYRQEKSSFVLRFPDTVGWLELFFTRAIDELIVNDESGENANAQSYESFKNFHVDQWLPEPESSFATNICSANLQLLLVPGEKFSSHNLTVVDSVRIFCPSVSRLADLSSWTACNTIQYCTAHAHPSATVLRI